MLHQPSPQEFNNWLPFKLVFNNSIPQIKWIYLNDIFFNHSFFSETIASCTTLNSFQNIVFKRESNLTTVELVANQIESIQPNCFIFHTSRCGSTLLSQILSTNNENIVYPEYEVLDDFIRLNHKMTISKENHKDLVKNLVKIMGQKRMDGQKRLFIKLDSWHIFFAKFLREIFPQTPFIFLYRHPEAIIQSNKKQKGIQFIPEIIDPKIYGLEKNAQTLNIEIDYPNAVLEKMYLEIIDFAKNDGYTQLMDYDNGMENNLIRLISFLRDENIVDEKEAKKRMSFHSKKPNTVFSEERNIENNLMNSQSFLAYSRLKELI